MMLPANFHGARGRRKLENHCPGLQAVVLSAGSPYPVFENNTACERRKDKHSILPLACKRYQPTGHVRLDERGRFAPYSIHETGLSYAFLASAERGELPPPATSSARQFHDGANFPLRK